MSIDYDKDGALAGLRLLIETCKSALVLMATSNSNTSDTKSVSVDILRKDALSLHRLIYTSTTRLSVSLGKPPPSYPLAQVPLKDLASQVTQLTSCTCTFPPGILRKEAVRAAEETIRALTTLVQHFEKQCQRDEINTDEYLAKTGVVHEAVMQAEKLSNNETEAITKAWNLDRESLEDSLHEVNQMVEENDVENSEAESSDGWDELGEGFGRKLTPEELQRVKQILPFLRLTTLLHGKILSQHILKPLTSQSHTASQMTCLVTFSNSLPLANDELASSLYAPQDVESIKGAAQLVYDLTRDLDRELGVTEASTDKVPEELAGLQLGSGAQRVHWFKNCFLHIYRSYDHLDLGK